MDLIICFIDDSDFEHDLVKNEIAPSSPELTFVQAYTFDQARKLLGQRTPVLFLLDLWGQDPVVKNPELTTMEELRAKTAEFSTIEAVYEGLQDFRGDRNNEYLKRLFTIVDSWRNLFEEVCRRIGQNRGYGLSNLAQVRLVYPGTPAVFYTRKSLISDAVAMFKAGADGLFIKPTGKSDGETRALTNQYGPTLIQEISMIVDHSFASFEGNHGLNKNSRQGEEDRKAAFARAPLREAWKSYRKFKKTTVPSP
jgi:DNA-binding NarL/FixJ family response regulator